MREFTVSDKNVKLTYIGSGVPKRADMVSVVRCRDCRNFERDCKQGDRDAYWCAKVMLYVEPDGFCAWGERRVVSE